jgi:O-succinylbenzoate synthase
MKIEQIELHHIALPLLHPFETSFGVETTRHCILVELHAEGLTGWGECTASSTPAYSYETVETAWHILRDFLIPVLLAGNSTAAMPPETTLLASGRTLLAAARVRGHPMAHAALESTLWDVQAQAEGLSLARRLGGQRERVPVGVSVGIAPTTALLLQRVEQHLAEGYRRIKLKIKPGHDVAPVRAVRERWPHIVLQVDANAAYTPAAAPILHELDQYDLLLIEQPFHYDDLVEHARLQEQLHTPICLDESIHSPAHARQALDMGACRTINIKVGRVGGLTAAREIHDLCAGRGVAVWCGGMLETNVGRATNVALAALPGFNLPGDISASARYYPHDIATPNFALNDDSTLTVPDRVGLGVHVLAEQVARVRLRHQVFTKGTIEHPIR